MRFTTRDPGSSPFGGSGAALTDRAHASDRTALGLRLPCAASVPASTQPGSVLSGSYAPRGISAATRVPPSAGLSTRSRPSRAASRSASPIRPLPPRRAPPTPSSRTSIPSVPSSKARRDRGAPGASVLGDVGQRLGDDEVGGRLDRRRQPAHGHVVLDRHRHPRRQRLHARAQPALREHRREDAVRELAQLGVRPLCLVERLGQQGGDVRARRSASAGAPAST